jgi:hypothetical protein
MPERATELLVYEDALGAASVPASRCSGDARRSDCRGAGATARAPYVPRGAAPGSGGALADDVVLGLQRSPHHRHRRENRSAVVSGVVNTSPEGRHALRPARARSVEPGACTIGGNVAENAAGRTA